MPASGGICERGLRGRVYGRCRSLFVVCSSIEAFLSSAAVLLCYYAFRTPGHTLYLEITRRKNWRSGTRDLYPERLCDVQAMVHFLMNRFRGAAHRADASVFEESTLIANPISGCENAGLEYASRSQHKCNDQGERRHISGESACQPAPPWPGAQRVQLALKPDHSLLRGLGIKRRPQ